MYKKKIYLKIYIRIDKRNVLIYNIRCIIINIINIQAKRPHKESKR